MAATAVAIGTMKVAQVSGPNGDFQVVEREIPKPGRGEVRIKVQACGVCHSDVAHEGRRFGREFSIRVFPDMRWRALSMRWVRALRSGRRVSVSAWAGMAGRTTRVCRAGAEIFATARI